MTCEPERLAVLLPAVVADLRMTTTEPLCEGCTALAERPITQAECEAALRRAAGSDPK